VPGRPSPRRRCPSAKPGDDSEYATASDAEKQNPPGELVHVWNVTNGERLETYVIAGEPGSGVVCMNGPAAHRIRQGDVVIVAAFALSDEPVTAKQILVDDRNHYLRDL